MNLVTLRKITVFMAITGIAACSTTATNTSTNTVSGITAEELQTRNEALLAKEAELAKKEAELQSMSAAQSQDAASYQSGGSLVSDLLPPGAKQGECYARVWVEPTYKKVSERVLVKEATKKYEIIPAKYETVEETVEVKPASSFVEVIPATYETVTEEKLVQEGGRYWRIDNTINSAPAGDELLNKAAAHGIDLGSTQPGTCYHEHFIPAKFEDTEENVLVAEAYEVIEPTEAEYRWVEKQILVREASTRIEEIPAVYKTVTEQVVDVPAHSVWKKGTGPIQKLNEATGEIMCLVEVPATYKTVEKTVMVSPASTSVVEIPAEYKTVKVKELVSAAGEVRKTIPAKFRTATVTKQVSEPSFVWHEIHDKTMNKQSRTGNQICLVEQPARYETVTRQVVKVPASSRKVDVPAEFDTLKVTKLVSAAETREINIPEEYKDIELRHLDKEGYMEWRSILCETNMDNGTVADIQRALQSRGYNPGKIDGVVGRDTMNAVNAFQKENDLPVDQYLNMQTIKALGVSI
ncbi:MAG: peptidoglycan-binding protein [Saccharospirillaceae bacterium]|nr:peptidoglycan-binding protein [Saccharospirillaceae bacterium]MCD8532690.1 peptidoglycan-binding protein [Saccharospirillaceae bacterium]